MKGLECKDITKCIYELAYSLQPQAKWRVRRSLARFWQDDWQILPVRLNPQTLKIEKEIPSAP